MYYNRGGLERKVIHDQRHEARAESRHVPATPAKYTRSVRMAVVIASPIGDLPRLERTSMLVERHQPCKRCNKTLTSMCQTMGSEWAIRSSQKQKRKEKAGKGV